MRKLVIHLALIWLFVGTADAMWVKLSDKELLDSSQLIVRATLTSEAEPEPNGPHIGILQIARVYQGSPGGEQIYLRLTSRRKPISSSDLVYPVGQQGIWFLKETFSGSGIFYLDHPRRLWPLEREAVLLNLLRQHITPDNGAMN